MWFFNAFPLQPECSVLSNGKHDWTAKTKATIAIHHSFHPYLSIDTLGSGIHTSLFTIHYSLNKHYNLLDSASIIIFVISSTCHLLHFFWKNGSRRRIYRHINLPCVNQSARTWLTSKFHHMRDFLRKGCANEDFEAQ